MDPLEREARRVYRRYQLEVVEALGLCPWAKQAREDGKIRVEVLLSEAPTLEEVLEVVDDVAKDLQTEIGILLFPKVTWERRLWDRFHSKLRNLDSGRYDYGASPLTSAAFHPVGEPDLSSGDVLKPFIRRSPDPLIQLVRISVLDAVRGERTGGTTVLDMNQIAGLDIAALKALTARPKSVSEVVAEANLRTVTRMGADELSELLDDIRRDRDEAYCRLSAGATGEAETTTV